LFSFIIATESYGARFAPTFVNYFNDQNDKITMKKIDGKRLKVDKLAISKSVFLVSALCP
jgi:hypothetical protein